MIEMQIMGASVPGTRHTLPGSPNWKNNQDAYSWLELRDGFVAVVCDGCSAGHHSEVGANLAAKKLVELVAAELAINPVADLPWSKIRDDLVEYLSFIAENLGADIVAIVEQYFLFTTVGIIVSNDKVCIFSIGDGVYAVNGEFTVLGPFPENKPPYVMYAVTGSTVTDANPELGDFQVCIFPAETIETVLIGCDGVEDMITAHEHGKFYPSMKKTVGTIERLFSAEFFSNPDNIRRHLALMNRETVEDGKIKAGLLPDDTTVVMARILRVQQVVIPEEIPSEEDQS